MVDTHVLFRDHQFSSTVSDMLEKQYKNLLQEHCALQSTVLQKDDLLSQLQEELWVHRSFSLRCWTSGNVSAQTEATADLKANFLSRTVLDLHEEVEKLHRINEWSLSHFCSWRRYHLNLTTETFTIKRMLMRRVCSHGCKKVYRGNVYRREIFVRTSRLVYPICVLGVLNRHSVIGAENIWSRPSEGRGQIPNTFTHSGPRASHVWLTHQLTAQF